MSDKTAKQNVIAIDIIRAIAALGVFYYHSHVGAIIAKYTGSTFLAVTDSFGATYSVPLFFLISGYCIHVSNIKYLKTNTPLPLKDYYNRRFFRIYPPYLLALFFALAVNYITIKNYAVNGPDLLIHLFSLQGFTVSYFNTINVVLWTISIELAFYAIYPLFYYIRYRYSLNYALTFSLLITCISVTYYIYKGSISLPERFCVSNLWFAWCSGAFLADKKIMTPGSLKQSKYILFYVAILITFIFLKYVPNNLTIISDQLNILIWTAPMVLILTGENWLQKKKNSTFVKILADIGVSSYSLYLFHEPLIYLKNFLVHQYFSDRFQPIGVMIGIVIIPVITWYSYNYIEKPLITKRKKPNGNYETSNLLTNIKH